MIEALASALWLIVQPCFDITNNWWMAILLFTIVIKVIMLPLSLWVQRNAILMVEIMPQLNRIKMKYYGDSENIGEAQSALYKEKHYHPMLSLIPLAIQILVLFGLVEVVRDITGGGYPGTDFMGLVPFEDGGLSWIMPLAAGVSAIILGYAQNRINPLQKEQGRAEKNMTNGLSIALSFILGMFVATGMGFYWVCSNLISIAIQVLCNIIIKPEKYIDYTDLDASQKELATLNALDKGTKRRKFFDPLSKREREDYKRFFKTINKHIVFYSEGSGYYKYFKGSIEWLLKNSDTPIHYVTNDPDDQVFELAKSEPRILPYFVGMKRSITLMMKIDADIVVTTLEDLDNYYIKRSYVRKDIEYTIMPHHMTSMHLTATKESYNHYDTVMCVGPHQVNELRKMEALYNLPEKTLVEGGYPLLDEIIRTYVKKPQNLSEKPLILIAPSWQEDCIVDSCIDDILNSLIGKGYKIIVRPHPEYTKRYRPRWEAVLGRFAHISEDELFFEKDFSSNNAVLEADLLITDWSSIFCEFGFTSLQPTIFVDTAIKVGNPDYKELDIDATDITLRNLVGKSVLKSETKSISLVVEDMLSTRGEWEEKIKDVRDSFIFNLGHADEVIGDYLLTRMLEVQEEKKQAKDE